MARTDEGQRRRGKFCSETLGKLREDKGGVNSGLKAVCASGVAGTVGGGGRRRMPPISVKFILHNADGRDATWGQELVAPASQ